MSKPVSAQTKQVATNVNSINSAPPKNAWAKGSPVITTNVGQSSLPSSAVASPRSQSPNPQTPSTVSHSRKSSGLGPGVAIKDGVSLPRNIAVSGHRQTPSINFGSIDSSGSPNGHRPDTQQSSSKLASSTAPVSTPTPSSTSSPSLPNVSTSSPTPSAASTATSQTSAQPQSTQHKKTKLDIHRMFQGNPQSQNTVAQPPPSVNPPSLPPSIPPAPAVSSPQVRSANLPPPAPHMPFVPPQSQPSHLRPHQPPAGGTRSPQLARNNLAQNPSSAQIPSRSVMTPVPSQVPQNSGPAQISSPRLAHQLPPHHQPPAPPQTPQHQVPPQMHVPMHPQQWPGYYPPYYPPQDYSMGAPAYWQQPGPHTTYLPPPHQHHHHPPPHSPRHAPISSLPPNSVPPSTSTPPINTSVTGSPAPTNARLSSTPLTPRAPEFIPSGLSGAKKPVRITNASGEAVTFRPPDNLTRDEKKEARKSIPIRLESEEDRKKRVDEETAKKRAEEEEKRKAEEEKRKAEEEQLRKEKEAEEERIRLEEEEKQRIENERLKREAEERRKLEEERQRKEEEERLKKEEEEERKAREEEERRAREEEEQRRKEAEEQERLRKEEEEARLKKEAEEKAKKDEEERLAEEARAKERERIELEEKQRKEERSKEAAATSSPKLATVTPGSKPAPFNTLNGDKPRRPVPGPLDLSNTNKPGMPAPLPSALATARVIDDLDSINYPPGIKTPDTELNQGNTKGGKFRYDRDFLLQFMLICKDKPDTLPPLDALGIEKEEGGGSAMGGYGSQGRAAGRRQTGSMGPPTGRSASLGLGTPLSGKGGVGPFPGGMGNFSTPSTRIPAASGSSSEERFAASNAMRSASAAFGGGRPTPMVRTSSQGGVGSRDGGPASPRENQRTRSQRGRQRNESLKATNAAAAQAAISSSLAHGGAVSQTPTSGLALEPVAPLQASENRWVPISKVSKSAAEGDSPEIVDRKVKALLNKLTMEKFESISNQIIAWANKSEKEKDGRTLIQVIRLVFEKATDEATWSEMYARLCRKMMEQISQNVQDDGIRNAEGNPITGGQLFRKYLLNRCQEDFERGWSMKESTAAAAAAKASEDKAVAEEAAAKKKEGKEDEVELYSDEYYAALKAKRQGLGLVKFIGELFKLSMLTERIMHECIKKLLSNVEDPEEEEIESLCKLLTTVGQSLDTAKAKGHMDIYFSRMSELSKNEKLTSRVRYMLQDVIELRHRNWLPRNITAVPQTRSQMQEATAKERAAQEKELARLPAMSRGGSRRGEGSRGDFNQNSADGWNVAGGGNQARPTPKAGDLSNFGKISKPGGLMNLGPSSVFKKEGKGRDTPQSLSRTASSSNMFSMLSAGAGENPVEPPPITARSQSNRGSSRKSSIDMSTSGTPASDNPVRKKIQLLPRTVGVSTATPDEKDESGQQSASEGEDSSAEPVKPAMTEGRAKAKIDEDVKEFFDLRKVDEAENYFLDLPEEYRHLLVDKLVSRALEGKEPDVKLVAELFSRVSTRSGCSSEAFEKGLSGTIEFLDDISIDVPHAYTSVAKLLKGTSLGNDVVESLASRIIVEGDPIVKPKDKLLKEFNDLAG